MRPKILERLRGVQRAGDGWLAFCPHHPDRVKRSLSVKFMEDGRQLVHCFVGCPTEGVVAAVGMTMQDLAPPGGDGQARSPLTLAAFAQAKGLPVEFLREHGVREDGDSLVIEYRLRDGSLAPRQRRRFALAAKDGSTWDGPRGVAPVAYGLWKLDDAIEKGELLLVEGETDTLTGWAHHFPCLGIPGADMAKVLTAEILEGIDRLDVLQEPDRGGATFICGIAARLKDLGWAGQAFAIRLPVKDLNELHVTAGDRFADELLKAKTAAIPLVEAVGARSGLAEQTAEPELEREGLDLSLAWPDGIRFALTAIRDGREGVRGELTVSRDGRRLSWGAFALSSTSAREALRKKLEALAPGPPWGEDLEEVCLRLTQAARHGEPLVTLSDHRPSPTRELVPRFLYEGEPTLLYGDGDTGKSLFAIALAAAVQGGAPLPFGLTPARAAPVAYLDWETSPDTPAERLRALAAGLGIAPPAIVYKRLAKPLVDEATALAAAFARRGIGLVVIDSMIYAIASGEGQGFHEPIVAFYNALRLFAPAASLVLSHVTADDARRSGPARPYGGAFAFNGPRLVWEARRDHDVTDATAIAFTCRKANNLPRRPEPFGLLFTPGEGRTTVAPFDLREAAPQTLAAAPLPYRLGVALAAGPQTLAELEDALQAKPESVRKALQRLREKGKITLDGELYRGVSP